MQTIQTASTEGAIWGRLLEARTATLSPEAARSILELDFTADDRARMHELAQKAQAGTLTAAEQEDIDNYGKVGSILGVLHSKARVALRNASKSSRQARR
jgi:hypothetical protein